MDLTRNVPDLGLPYLSLLFNSGFCGQMPAKRPLVTVLRASFWQKTGLLPIVVA